VGASGSLAADGFSKVIGCLRNHIRLNNGSRIDRRAVAAFEELLSVDSRPILPGRVAAEQPEHYLLAPEGSAYGYTVTAVRAQRRPVALKRECAN